ncbi:hypothetical protein BZG36_01407 [Bifiguratus adelaidae]|uniref:Uncharacterized protein n=1 Tax=Bifiguratus adelaidae TaxID=1938954 RepID=A0A261Y4X7_9FUNG|nr:hypothetical protein BZG36_01407 [Bifiguratus adelaidae]
MHRQARLLNHQSHLQEHHLIRLANLNRSLRHTVQAYGIQTMHMMQTLKVLADIANQLQSSAPNDLKTIQDQVDGASQKLKEMHLPAAIIPAFSMSATPGSTQHDMDPDMPPFTATMYKDTQDRTVDLTADVLSKLRTMMEAWSFQMQSDVEDFEK